MFLIEVFSVNRYAFQNCWTAWKGKVIPWWCKIYKQANNDGEAGKHTCLVDLHAEFFLHSDSGGKVNILGGNSVSHCKKKYYEHVSNCEWFLWESYLNLVYTVSPFLFSDALDFCLWGWMKSKVYKCKVDTQDILLACILDATAHVKEREDQLNLNKIRSSHLSCRVNCGLVWDFQTFIVYRIKFHFCVTNLSFKQ